MLSGQVSTAFLALLIDTLRERPAAAALLPALESSPWRGQLVMPITYWQQTLNDCAQALDDASLGQRLGASFTVSRLGPLGYVLQSCPTLGDAVARLQQYERLVNDINHLHLEQGHDEVHLVWGAERGRPGALVDECAIATLVAVTREITGLREAAPTRIDFINPPSPDQADHAAWFGCPLRYQQPLTRVVIPSAWLTIPLKNADAMLAQLLSAQVDALLAQLPDSDALIEQVRRHIAQAGARPAGQAASVAQALAVSERTLHRRLLALGTSYRQLREETLSHLACGYLRDQRLTLTEISELLGFSEQSAFSRAFRQWLGVSPLAWRRTGGASADQSPTVKASPAVSGYPADLDGDGNSRA